MLLRFVRNSFWAIILLPGCGPGLSVVADAGNGPHIEPVGASNVAPPLPSQSDLDERIKAILLQNSAARQGISSYSMKIAWELRKFPDTPLDQAAPEGAVVDRGEGIWMEMGSRWRVDKTLRWDHTDQQGSARGEIAPEQASSKGYSSWAVYNGEYYAWYNSRFPARIRLIPQPVLDAGLVKHEPELFPFPLMWGFGFGSATMEELYESSLERTDCRWEVEEIDENGGPKVKLSRIISIPGEKAEGRGEFVLDPQRDFLGVRSTAWDHDGVKAQEYRTELAQWADGRWYPSLITKRVPDSLQTFTISEVVFNPTLNDEQFTIESFGMDLAQISLRRVGLDRKETRMQFRDGEWIPETMVSDAIDSGVNSTGR